MMDKLKRRLGALEHQALPPGRWHVLEVPPGLSEPEQDAWIQTREAELPKGDHAIVLVMLEPEPRKPAGDAHE
jgi:hypothetical protein